MNHHPARGILYLCLGVLVFSALGGLIYYGLCTWRSPQVTTAKTPT